MWDLPGPGLEPVSPALAGEFLTTVPPGKPSLFIMLLKLYQNLALGARLVGTCVPLTYPIIVGGFCFGFLFHFVFVYFLVIHYFLTPQNGLGSSCILSSLVLDSTISPRSPYSFHYY